MAGRVEPAGFDARSTRSALSFLGELEAGSSVLEQGRRKIPVLLTRHEHRRHLQGFDRAETSKRARAVRKRELSSDELPVPSDTTRVGRACLGQQGPFDLAGLLGAHRGVVVAWTKQVTLRHAQDRFVMTTRAGAVSLLLALGACIFPPAVEVPVPGLRIRLARVSDLLHVLRVEERPDVRFRPLSLRSLARNVPCDAFPDAQPPGRARRPAIGCLEPGVSGVLLCQEERQVAAKAAPRNSHLAACALQDRFDDLEYEGVGELTEVSERLLAARPFHGGVGTEDILAHGVGGASARWLVEGENDRLALELPQQVIELGHTRTVPVQEQDHRYIVRPFLQEVVDTALNPANFEVDFHVLDGHLGSLALPASQA